MIAPVIERRVPEIHPICAILKSEIIDPIERGEETLPKSFENLEAKDGQTIMDVLEEAIQKKDLETGAGEDQVMEDIE